MCFVKFDGIVDSLMAPSSAKVLEEVLLEWWAAGSRITVSWKTGQPTDPALHVIPIFLRPLKGMGQNSFVSHSGGWHAGRYMEQST